MAFTIQYNTTLLPSVNTLIARGMFCGAKYTHHTFTPIIKHLITTANKHPGKKSLPVFTFSINPISTLLRTVFWGLPGLDHAVFPFRREKQNRGIITHVTMHVKDLLSVGIRGNR